ncbi:hypothetical protein Ahy_A06g028298 [Arachis hypogaea]|uniref:Protein FAR1-RELATED SEQUENCE n=1 Tax=Arachis hypogaea TaxID=3818 RepID=A0A445CQV3_ARAHY|nr:hypothetical protein Ahy_A06g028298 [Arachis hypogaea]
MAIDFDLNTVSMVEGAEEFEQQTDSPDDIVVSQSIFENMKNYTSSDEVINQAIGDEELESEEGMCFSTLEDARAYYYQYAVRTGFVIKIRTTGWETRNGQRMVVNQALHGNRDGYHTSRVKSPKRRKTVASTNCKVHRYLALDKRAGYDMPFGAFVDVNHHRMSTLLGCTLLRKWLFPTWLKCMDTKSCIARSHQKFNVIALCSNRMDFVATPEVAAILHDAMDSALHKLKEHKESEHQAAHVPSAINSHTRDECPVSMDELQRPRRVPTRGRPTSTRLGANLEKYIKKRTHKHKNTHNHNKGPNGNA